MLRFSVIYLRHFYFFFFPVFELTLLFFDLLSFLFAAKWIFISTNNVSVTNYNHINEVFFYLLCFSVCESRSNRALRMATNCLEFNCVFSSILCSIILFSIDVFLQVFFYPVHPFLICILEVFFLNKIEFFFLLDFT